MPALPKALADYFPTEDSIIAVVASWLLAPVLGAALGFMLLTIVGADHTVDLQVGDMVRGGLGAVGGFVAGIVLALVVTLFYPRIAAADEKRSEDEHERSEGQVEQPIARNG